MSAWAFSHAALALDCVDREEMRAKAASMIKRTAPKALPERPTLEEMRHSRLYTAGSCVCSCVRDDACWPTDSRLTTRLEQNEQAQRR
jgi:hypothetical protein